MNQNEKLFQDFDSLDDDFGEKTISRIDNSISFLEKIWKNPTYKKIILTLLTFIAIPLSILYFSLFTQDIYSYRLQTYEKKATTTGFQYTSQDSDSTITIDRTKSTIYFDLYKGSEYHITAEYEVSIGESELNRNNFPLLIFHEGEALFDGFFIQTGSNYYLEDNSGESYFPSIVIQTSQSDTAFDFDISLYSIVALFQGESHMRGDIQFLFLAILLFFLAFIDIKCPDLFFTLRHFMEVENAQPTDFYRATQKFVNYILVPTLIFACLLCAIYI